MKERISQDSTVSNNSVRVVKDKYSSERKLYIHTLNSHFPGNLC